MSSLFTEQPLVLSVTVLGPAASQGSKTPIRNKQGQAVGSRESSKKVKPWRQDVKALMVEELERTSLSYDGDHSFTLWDEAVFVALRIYVLRPKGHFNSKGQLKPTAPQYPPSGLDVDKVQRAVGDAMKGIWVRDDARISKWDSERLYDERERTVITAQLRRTL